MNKRLFSLKICKSSELFRLILVLKNSKVHLKEGDEFVSGMTLQLSYISVLSYLLYLTSLYKKMNCNHL